MADDVIPDNDDEFNDFQKQFIDAVKASPAAFGLTDADVAALVTAAASWAQSLPAHKKAQADAQTATQKKDLDRKTLTDPLRAAARKVGATASVTNDMRVSAGLAARAGTRSPKGAPSTRPIGRIDAQAHRTMVINFADEETPTRTAKPASVHGCEVWTFVGDAEPASPSDYSFLGLDTRTPYTDVHDAADAGKTAYYLLRWQNKKGEPGPWSGVISAKITG